MDANGWRDSSTAPSPPGSPEPGEVERVRVTWTVSQRSGQPDPDGYEVWIVEDDMSQTRMTAHGTFEDAWIAGRELIGPGERFRIVAIWLNPPSLPSHHPDPHESESTDDDQSAHAGCGTPKGD